MLQAFLEDASAAERLINLKVKCGMEPESAMFEEYLFLTGQEQRA